MNWYLNWWPNNYPPSKTTEGYNLFLGSAGRGNIFLRVYMMWKMKKNRNKLSVSLTGWLKRKKMKGENQKMVVII